MKGKNFTNGGQRAKYIAMDFVMSCLAFFVFNVFRYFFLHINLLGFKTLGDFLASPPLILEQILVPVCLLALYGISGYYNHPLVKSRLSELTTTLWSTFIAAIAIYLVFMINDTSGARKTNYEVILVLFGILTAFIYFGRWVITSFTIRYLRKRKWRYSTLIIGNSRKSRQMLKKLQDAGSVWAFDVIGFIRIEKEHNIEDDHNTWDWEEVEKICVQYKVDQIILCPENIRDSQIMTILERLFPLGLPVKIAPDTLSFVTGNIRLNDILGIPFIDLTSPRMSDFETNIKRIFDVTASALALILLSPLLGIVAIGVRLGSKGPVIYRQERMGKGHKPFEILKFRSMYDDAEKNGPMLSNAKDDRITPVGRLMRKYRIDELPQFWNVLKGEMSLVGPRPEREYYVEQIMKKAPYYGLIFQVRPGVTSWGMVKYGYASTVKQMVERSRYDLIYINNMSISTDLKIMIYTIKTVISGAGM